jgi:hypothetical protein
MPVCLFGENDKLNLLLFAGGGPDGGGGWMCVKNH